MQKESIMKAAWPTAGPVDEGLVKESSFLESAIRDFRLRLKAYLAPKGKVRSLSSLS